MLRHSIGRPVVEVLCDAALERTLQRDVGQLKLAGAVGRNEDEMNTRMLALQPGTEFIALVHRPAVQQQQDVRIGIEAVRVDHPLRMRMKNIGDPALHRLLRAPVVSAVGDVSP